MYSVSMRMSAFSSQASRRISHGGSAVGLACARVRTKLFHCIGSLIDEKFNGRIRKCYLKELIVARKRDGLSSTSYH
jgi:hypothetical protein